MKKYKCLFYGIKIAAFLLISMSIVDINSMSNTTIANSTQKKEDAIRKINEDSKNFIKRYGPTRYGSAFKEEAFLATMLSSTFLGAFMAKGMVGDYNPKLAAALGSLGKAAALPLLLPITSGVMHLVSENLYQYPVLSKIAGRMGDVIHIATHIGMYALTFPFNKYAEKKYFQGPKEWIEFYQKIIDSPKTSHEEKQKAKEGQEWYQKQYELSEQ